LSYLTHYFVIVIVVMVTIVIIIIIIIIIMFVLSVVFRTRYFRNHAVSLPFRETLILVSFLLSWL
jgi:hypothetical protein